ncbi:MAG: glycosyltransferase family 2 protein [Gammaproteobacteria bacterium]|nr:glycosyltransferase family 2 protein [Gammaproteobacteria bacterium]MDH3410923.1 glycosyltransferase family 2 protein [Gammaproteobacteria bacterium]
MLSTESRDTRLEAASQAAPKPVGVSVVIPAYNEEMAIVQTVAAVNQALSGLSTTYEVVVVDDGSTDGTAERAESTSARVIRCGENGGYGSALKRGIAASDSEFVAIIDADGTYPAAGLLAMLDTAEHADMVVGARNADMTNVPFIRRPAKFILNSLANYLAQKKIPDLNSGLRVFRRGVLTRFIPLLPMGFSFTTTITLCMICSGLRVVYVPIEYGRRIGNSKIRFTDFFNFILLVLRAIVLFNPLRVFLPLGFALFLLGVSKLVYDIFIGDLSESAVLGILAAIIIWSFGLIADMLARLHLRP